MYSRSGGGSGGEEIRGDLDGRLGFLFQYLFMISDYTSHFWLLKLIKNCAELEAFVLGIYICWTNVNGAWIKYFAG